MQPLKTIIIIALFFLPTASFAAGSCWLDNGPTPLFLEYLQTTQNKVSQIKSFVQKNNTCKGTIGSFSQERRFFETIDRIDNNTPGLSEAGTYTHLLDDFLYNVVNVAKWNGKQTVMNHGKLIRNLETGTILPALQSAGNACALDVSMKIEWISGDTPESALSILLIQNKKLEDYYKKVVLGFPNTSESDPTLRKIFDEIRDNYSPEKTISCNSTSGFDEISTKFQKSIEKSSAIVDSSSNSWKEAIALFRWENTQSAEYFALQRRLLANELARQGVSGNAAKVMLGTLSCVQQNGTQNSSPQETMEAALTCRNNLVIGFSNIIAWLTKSYQTANNTESYIANLIMYKKEEEKLSTNMTDIWTSVQAILIDGNSATDAKSLTNLVDLHASLSKTNELIKAEIPKMRKACMLGQPDIQCPK